MTTKNLDPLRPLDSGSVAIVGFGPTRESAPWADVEGWPELWTLNRLALQPDAKRWTRHFDSHLVEWSAEHFDAKLWTEYREWLSADHGTKPIYLPAPVEWSPNSVQLPVEQLCHFVGRRYFTSGIAYMLGMAMLLGAKRIGLWGIDFRHDTEFEFERPNAEWLLGVAQGLGIELVLPANASILNQDGTQPLYGIEELITPLADVERMLSNRITYINTQMPQLQAKNEGLLREMYLGEGARLQCEGFLEAIRRARRGGPLEGAERK